LFLKETVNVWKLHFTRVFGLVDGLGHRSKFKGAVIDDGGEGQEMLNGGMIEGKRNGGEGSRVRGDGRKSEGGQGNMMRGMENEDAFSVNVQSQCLRRHRCVREYRRGDHWAEPTLWIDQGSDMPRQHMVLNMHIPHVERGRRERRVQESV
jgi:hypothetical protein